MKLSLVALPLLAILIAGCGRAGASNVPASSTSAVTPKTSVVSLCAHEFEGCTIAAGTYSSNPFVPEFEFTVDDGWTNDRAWQDGGAISKGTTIFNWIGAPSGGTRDGVPATFAPSAADLVTYLQSFDGFEVEEQAAVSVGGDEGRVIDVATRQTDAPGLLEMEEDHYNLRAGQKARFVLIERNGTLVVFIIESVQEQEFDMALAEAQPVLASIRWQE